VPEFQPYFKKDTTYSNYNYRDSSVYWIKFPVRFTTGSKKKWLLEFYDQTIDHIEAYVPNAAVEYQKKYFGDLQIFDQRTLPHKNFYIIFGQNLPDFLTY